MGKTEKHVKFINKPKRSKVDVHMMWSAIGILLIISGMNKADGADCELAAEGNCRRVDRQVLIDGSMTSMEAWKFVRMFKKRHTTKESCTAYCATGFPKWPQSCCTWDSKYKQCFFVRGYEWTEYSAAEKAKWGGEDARYLRSGCMTDTAAAAAAAKAAAESAAAAAAPKPKTSQWCTFFYHSAYRLETMRVMLTDRAIRLKSPDRAPVRLHTNISAMLMTTTAVSSASQSFYCTCKHKVNNMI